MSLCIILSPMWIPLSQKLNFVTPTSLVPTTIRDSFEVDANITHLLIRLRNVKGCVQFVSGEATRT